MNENKISRTEMLKRAHDLLDSTFESTFPADVSELVALDVTMNSIYNGLNMSVFQMMWNIGLEVKPAPAVPEVDHSYLMFIGQLGKAGYFLMNVPYTYPGEIVQNISVVEYPDGSFIPEKDGRKLSISEQWELAWAHYQKRLFGTYNPTGTPPDEPTPTN